MFDNDSADDGRGFRALSRDEAAVIKRTNPPLNPWRVVVWQLLVTLGLGLLGLLVMSSWSIALSLVWGGLCVVVPAALFARGMMSKATLMNAGTATAGFFLWELVKIALTLAMLFSAGRVLQNVGHDVNWPALLIGLVVTMKVYWLALLCKPRVRQAIHN